jgi:uncharacterized protein (TIGR01777 family)
MSGRPLRIVIPGGSGLVGELLARHFQERGHHVTVLTRSPYSMPWQTVHWTGSSRGPWVETLEGADVCINLTGRSVNCRYTARNRQEIYGSRIHATQLVGDAIASLENPPRLWMNASTATIYRHSLDRLMDEATGELGGYEMVEGLFGSSRPAPDSWNFSVQVARDWESALWAARTPGTRKIALRTTIVFSPAPGSAFAVLSWLVRVGLGGTQGSGRQYVSWIHEEDFARAVEFLVDHEEIEGPVNLGAPRPLPNREFMAGFREAWEMPNGVWAPAPIIEIGSFFMRTESELVLKSRYVVPRRLLDAGFVFRFFEWPKAAADLVQRWKQRRDCI